MATSKKKTTTPTPNQVSITREGRRFTAKWAKPEASKVSGVSVTFSVVLKDGTKRSYAPETVAKSATSKSWTFPEADYYPAKDRMVKAVKATVTFGGVKDSDGKKGSTATYRVSAPSAPTATLDRDGTVIRVNVSAADGGEDWMTKADYRFATGTGGTAKLPTKATALPSSGSFSAVAVNGIDRADSVTAKVEAYAYGPGGRSSKASATRHVSRPRKPIVTDARTDSTACYFLTWAYDATGGYPVDGFGLAYYDAEYGEEVGSTSDWTDVEGGISPETTSHGMRARAEVPENRVRHFTAYAEHDGLRTYGDPARYREHGALSRPTGVEAAFASPNAAESAIRVRWAAPDGLPDDATAGIRLIDETHSSSWSALAGAEAYETIFPFDTSVPYRVGVDFTYFGYGRSETVWSDWIKPVQVGLDNLEVRADVENLLAELTWENVGTDIVDGVTVAYSPHEDAFISNEQPKRVDFDGSLIEDIAHMDRAVIRGLEKGERYWFWVRRKGTADGVEVKGAWQRADVPMGEQVAGGGTLLVNPIRNVVLTLARTWVRPDNPVVQAAWTWSSDDEEDGPLWSVIDLYPAGSTSADDVIRSWTVQGSADSATVELRDAAGGVLPVGAYDVAVTVVNRFGAAGCGEPRSVSVAQEPTCSLSVADGDGCFEVTAHPVTAGEAAAGAVATTETVLKNPDPVLSCEATPGAVLALSVRAAFDYALIVPDGTARVYAGEVVFSADASDGEVVVPGTALLDGCAYVAELVATDPVSGLESEPSRIAFSVDWERKAATPGAEVAADGLSVSVIAAKDAEADEADTCELYRLTPDGAVLMYADAEWGVAHVDDYAPYNWGGAAVRVACRTPYGSVAWGDFPYETANRDVTIDWPGGSVSLPYNVAIDDQREKDGEVTSYLDGTKRSNVGPAVKVNQKIAADLVLAEDDARLWALEEVSRYAGDCMVRTPKGDAYAAVVNVAITKAAGAGKYSVTVDATETSGEGEYMARRTEEE